MVHSVDRVALKAPAPGTEQFLTIHRFGTPDARPKVYFQAALHADEWPGLMALHHLIPMLAEADRAGSIIGEVIVLPYANPIGLGQRLGSAVPGRYAFDGSGNFNRDWPDLSAAAAGFLTSGFSGDSVYDIPLMQEALRQSVKTLPTRTAVDHWKAQVLTLSVDADYVIDIHCDQESLAHLYCHAGHRDIAVELAAAVGVPIVLLEDEAGGFSFDDCHAGVWRRLDDLVAGGESLARHCFACTLELRGKDDVNDQLGRSDALGLLNFLIQRGVIAGEAEMNTDAPETYRLDEVDVVTTQQGGLVAYQVDVGEHVSKGQLMAEVIDIAASDPLDARVALFARTDGLFFARGDLRLVSPGETIGKIAGRTPLAHRTAGSLLED